MSRTRFIAAVLWSQLGRVGEVGLSLLFTIFIVRTLSEASFGAYNTVVTFISLTTYVLSLGLSDGLLRFVPVVKAEHPQAPFWLFRRILLIRSLACLAMVLVIGLARTWIALWLNQPVFESDTWLIILLVIIYNLVELVNSFYTALLQVGRNVLIRLLSQLTNLLLALFFFKLVGPSEKLLIICLALSNLLTLVLGFVRIIKPVWSSHIASNRPLFQSQLHKVYSYSRDLWLINLITIGLLGHVDIFLLALLSGNSLAVPYYSLAALLISRFYLLISAWSTSLNSITSTVLTEKGLEGLERYFVYCYRFSLPIHLIPMVGLAALSVPLTNLVFGSRYEPVALLIVLFVAQNVLDALLGVTMCSSFINTLGRQKLDLIWRCVFSLLNLILDIILIPYLGAMGAVIATTTANGLLHVAQGYLVKELFAKLGWSYTLKLASGVLSGGLITLLVGGEGLLALLLKGTVYVLYLALFFLVIKPLKPADKELIGNVNPRLAKYIRFF